MPNAGPVRHKHNTTVNWGIANMSLLYRILYCSRNCLAGEVDTYQEEIEAILAKSRANNARDGVTGGLLFSDGCFAQVLEGPLANVETAFERIQCDPRHKDVTVLQAGPIETRGFPDWSMAFTGAAKAVSPVAKVAMLGALAGQTEAADEVLRLLTDVVVREDEWLAV